LVGWGYRHFKYANSGYVKIIIPETDHKFISKTNSVYKGNCSFRMNIIEETFEIRRCVEILCE